MSDLSKLAERLEMIATMVPNVEQYGWWPDDVLREAASALRAQAMSASPDAVNDELPIEMLEAGAVAYENSGFHDLIGPIDAAYRVMRPLDPYVVALERDAGRYRWLRDHAGGTFQLKVTTPTTDSEGEYEHTLFGKMAAEYLDKCIDAALPPEGQQNAAPQWWCETHGGLIDAGRDCVAGCKAPDEAREPKIRTPHEVKVMRRALEEGDGMAALEHETIVAIVSYIDALLAAQLHAELAEARGDEYANACR